MVSPERCTGLGNPLVLTPIPSYNMPPCEAAVPFALRLSQRFSVTAGQRSSLGSPRSWPMDYPRSLRGGVRILVI